MSKTLFDVLKECKLNRELKIQAANSCDNIQKFKDELKNSKWEVQYNEEKI